MERRICGSHYVATRPTRAGTVLHTAPNTIPGPAAKDRGGTAWPLFQVRSVRTLSEGLHIGLPAAAAMDTAVATAVPHGGQHTKIDDAARTASGGLRTPPHGGVRNGGVPDHIHGLLYGPYVQCVLAPAVSVQPVCPDALELATVSSATARTFAAAPATAPAPTPVAAPAPAPAPAAAGTVMGELWGGGRERRRRRDSSHFAPHRDRGYRPMAWAVLVATRGPRDLPLGGGDGVQLGPGTHWPGTDRLTAPRKDSGPGVGYPRHHNGSPRATVCNPQGCGFRGTNGRASRAGASHSQAATLATVQGCRQGILP